MAPPQKAIDNGHELEWDAPHALSSVERWTCKREGCRRAALRYNGNEYGLAVDEECTPRLREGLAMHADRVVDSIKNPMSMAERRRTLFLRALHDAGEHDVSASEEPITITEHEGGRT